MVDSADGSLLSQDQSDLLLVDMSVSLAVWHPGLFEW